MDQDWAEVLDDKNGSPSDLRAYEPGISMLILPSHIYESGVLEGHTKILDDDFACSDNGRFIFNAGLTVLECLLRFGVV